MKSGGMKKGYRYSRKRFWYNNGQIETLIFEDELPPKDFVKGRLKTHKPAWNTGLNKYTDKRLLSMSENKKENYIKRKWITNGETEKLFYGDVLPDGYIFGRLSTYKYNSYTDEYLYSTFISTNKFKDYWNSHGYVDCCKYFNLNFTVIDRIIKLGKFDSPKEHHKKLENIIYSEEWRNNQSKKLKGKNTWSKGKKQSESTIEKRKISFSKRTESDIQNSKYKEYLTRKNNNSYNKHMTKDECIIFEYLSTLFSPDDIIYQYMDERYPFNCDFYIKSEELFIELNIYPSHGGHPFDKNNDMDIDKLHRWENKVLLGKRQYQNWIYTWTDLDLRKINTANNNNIKIIFAYSIKEAKDKINEFCKNKINKKEEM